MMIHTNNDLSLECRREVVEHLNQRLAEAIDLAHQAKQAHWNVKGMQFRSLHKLFDRLHGQAAIYTDQFAERLVQLGGVAEGTLQAVSARTSLPEYPVHLLEGRRHLERISESVSSFCQKLRQCIDDCEEAGDKVSSDMMIDAARDFDELNWMIEAHFYQDAAVGSEESESAEPHARPMRKAVG